MKRISGFQSVIVDLGKGFSINSAFSEKRLIFDTSERNEELTVRAMSDLEACYDMQLPNVGGIVEESVGENRQVAYVIAKMSPIMDHHVGAGHDTSTNYLGSPRNLMGGAGQGNVF